MAEECDFDIPAAAVLPFSKFINMHTSVMKINWIRLGARFFFFNDETFSKTWNES